MARAELDYETWSEFRYQIRRYLRTAEAAARDHGLEPQQHQLLLAVRGYPRNEAPTIGDLAERLQLRHHSTVELVNRMEQAGLVRREPTGVGRAVSVKLTAQGRRALDSVSDQLQPDLGEAGRELIGSLSKLLRADGMAAGAPRPAPRAASKPTPAPRAARKAPAAAPAPRTRASRAAKQTSAPAPAPTRRRASSGRSS
ncbi:MAG: MarR family winged helix-turn-helix transcriptional regulator [Dehalococcoidia bacterium]